MDWSRLKRCDELQNRELGHCTCFIHTEHRWVLPILRWAQEEARVPSPVALLLFDAHTDSTTPKCIRELERLRAKRFSADDLLRVCSEQLSERDDDWLKAGMELGLIGDAVVLGVSSGNFLQPHECVYKDHVGKEHRIVAMGHPGDEFGHQGKLGNAGRVDEFAAGWRTLGWECSAAGVFRFAPNLGPVWLDVDLDSFVVHWDSFFLPWPAEVWEAKYLQESSYACTRGWTGQRFFEELLSHAGLVTIAREPSCCGDSRKAAQILADVDKYLLAGAIGERAAG